MSLLDLLTGSSNGLGGAFAVLWAWFGVRVLLYSWEITEAAAHIRADAWVWWRAGIVILSITMSVPYNLENILRAEELISPLHAYALLNVAHVMHCVALSCYSVGLDVSLGDKQSSLPVYLSIPILFAIAGIMFNV